MTLLRIEGLHIEAATDRGAIEIVKGIDLDLRQGEILGLIGESGAGKTTLGLAAMGYLRPGSRATAGRVLFRGQDLLQLPLRARQRHWGKDIAYVAQSAAASFNPFFRLIDQYVEAPVFHRTADRATAAQDGAKMFGRVMLPHPETIGFRYPHQVSGGQLQRAMTAMAMACRPALIIFDEPTTALDVTTQIEVLLTIQDIVRRFGTAAIYISHDLAVVAQVADRVKVLLRGEEVEEAPTRRMLEAPQEAYTRSLWAVRRFRRQGHALAGRAPLLSVSGVRARYGTTEVLHGVDLAIAAGETLAIVGESGSGKSSMARVITGLLPPAAGTVAFDGAPLPPRVQDRTPAQLRGIQLVHQAADTALNPRQRVAEILGWPVQRHRGLKGAARTTRVRELLDMIGLEPDRHLDRFPSELSGGQKQRIAIARALAAEPRLIICDEVTASLDQIVAEGILRLLDGLQQALGVSYLLITHDIALVRAMADSVVVMKAGQVVDRGPAGTVLSPPMQDYTQALVAAVPEMDVDWLARIAAARRESGGELH